MKKHTIASAAPEESSGAAERRRPLTGFHLKLIAIIAMTVDHFTWAIFPGLQKVPYVIALHIVGRLTAPIMWFFIAEGSFYTKNRKKYILRLFLFALISHFAYGFAFGIPFLPFSGGSVFNQTSVLWSLALSATLIAVYRSEKISAVWRWVILIAFCLLGFPSDWSSIAVMAPFFLYFHRGNLKKQAIDIVLWTAVYAAVYVIFLDRVYGFLQLFTALSIPLLALYGGKRGGGTGKLSKAFGKWFFYLYYPLHLVIVGIVRIAIHGSISIIF